MKVRDYHFFLSFSESRMVNHTGQLLNNMVVKLAVQMTVYEENMEVPSLLQWQSVSHLFSATLRLQMIVIPT
jgi:hypothetical protein